MTRLPDVTFSQHKLGAEKLRALRALAGFKTLRPIGRYDVAERYAVLGSTPVHRRTITQFAAWGYATIAGDGAATVTHLGTMADNYWRRQAMAGEMQARREESARIAEREEADERLARAERILKRAAKLAKLK